jgi:primosomal protein N''
MTRDYQRDIALLTTQLASELGALDTWVRCLEIRTRYEETHGGTSQLPTLRQECARCHVRVIELERRLLDLRREQRLLLARQDAK